jgi:cell division protein FtsZ
MSEMGMSMMGSGSATGEHRAREAAEKAISSPLLEDINIAGAQGILVNVTAGMDLSIGEFTEVGNAITEKASEEANVIVGTVIDSEMPEGELRVTLVATGLGRENQAVEKPPVEEAPKVEAVTATEKVARTGSYDSLDTPTYIRQQGKRVSGDSVEIANDKEKLDYLEIPAFLRRQAD